MARIESRATALIPPRMATPRAGRGPLLGPLPLRFTMALGRVPAGRPDAARNTLRDDVDSRCVSGRWRRYSQASCRSCQDRSGSGFAVVFSHDYTAGKCRVKGPNLPEIGMADDG